MARSFEAIAANRRARFSPEAQEFDKALQRDFAQLVAAQEALGREIRNARQGKHLSQAELQNISNVQQAEISRIERGVGNPTAETLMRVTRALDVRVGLIPESTAH